MMSSSRNFLSWIVTIVSWFTVLPIMLGITGYFVPDPVVAALAIPYIIALRILIRRGFEGGFGGRTIPRGAGNPTVRRFEPPVTPTSRRGSVSSPPRIPGGFGGASLGAEREHGVAGGAIGAGGTFGEANTSAGVEGERRTGKLIRDAILSKHPNAHIVHGLLWPGSTRSDIDHVLIVPTARGDFQFVLDSKMWKRGNYAFDGQVTYRDGQRAHEVKFVDAVEKMANKHPRCTTIGIIIVHGAQRVDDLQVGSHRTFMMTPDQAIAYIDSTCGVPVTRVPDTRVVKSLIAQRK